MAYDYLGFTKYTALVQLSVGGEKKIDIKFAADAGRSGRWPQLRRGLLDLHSQPALLPSKRVARDSRTCTTASEHAGRRLEFGAHQQNRRALLLAPAALGAVGEQRAPA